MPLSLIEKLNVTAFELILVGATRWMVAAVTRRTAVSKTPDSADEESPLDRSKQISDETG
jgi:hypothetical protein